MKFKNILINLYLFSLISIVYSNEIASQNLNLQNYKKFLELQNSENSVQSTALPAKDSLVTKYILQSDSAKVLNKYFGYDYFTKRFSIEVWDNLPASKEYILGPGDEIIINVWGDTQVNSSHVIDKEGKIFIDKIGRVTLTGKSLQAANRLIINKLSKIYSTLSGEYPTSSLDISLGELKSLNISVIGGAINPGLHKVHPFSTITTCLYQIGGVETFASLRNIKLYRNDKLFKSFDFYDFFSGKDLSQDVQLKDGDVISIPQRESLVEIQGSVNRPAYYEMYIDESIEELIHFSGGLLSNASSIAVIDRFNIKDRVEYINKNEWSKRFVKNGDIVTVFEKPELLRSVAIYGQVKLPGEYPYSEGMNILDLLSIAAGIDDPAFLESMYLKKAQIVRRSYNEAYPNVILIDIEKAINRNSKHNIQLKNQDVIIINQNPNYESPQLVNITGEVNIPGVYTIQENSETLRDILNRSGGFTSKAFEDGIQMYRDSGQVVLQNYDIVVIDGDSLHVPKHPGIIFVKGEVYNPGLIQFNKGKSLHHYIERAGGFNVFADNSRIVVFYANGDVKIKKWYSNPKIKEGSTIVVYPREVQEPIDWTEFAKNISSIIASFATIVILINQ